MRNVLRATLALVAVAVAAVAVAGAGSAAPQATVTIGWAYDGVGAMAAYDGPALATAKERIKAVNKTSVTKLRLITCNTQGNKPAIAKACAAKLQDEPFPCRCTHCSMRSSEARKHRGR